MNVASIKNCFGCGVCSVACPRRLIDLRLNEDGFYEPFLLDTKACTNCGLCISVCAYSNVEITSKQVIKSFAARSREREVMQSSTSGGVSYELGKTLLSKGYLFCGAVFDAASNMVRHVIVDNLSDLKATQGSKYLQSYTLDALSKLDRKKKTVLVGTPCMIASYRRYIKKYRCEENFLLVDFFCHGVPSKLMWNKYVQEKDIGVLTNASWRNKQRGWREGYCISLEGTNKTLQSFAWDGDDFYTLFLGDACLGKACYDNCRFKYNNSEADIRLGDLWGKANKNENKGTCAVICFTFKGLDLINTLEIDKEDMPFEQCADGQMQENPRRPWYYEMAMSRIKDNNSGIKRIALAIRFYNKISKQLKKIRQRFTMCQIV